MIGPVSSYCSHEVWPRAGRVLLTFESILAAVAGVAAGLRGDHMAMGRIDASTAATVLMTYATMAFGFSLAGLTIALTLPDKEFATTLANDRPRGETDADSYSDLLFVFSWTAAAHWLLVVSSILLLVMFDPKNAVLPSDAGTARRLFVGVTGGLVIYGVCQFLITLITLSQVGRLYISALRKRT